MIAEFHTRAINEIENARVVGSLEPQRRPTPTRSPGWPREAVRPSTIWTHCWRIPELDVVCICTPSGAHMEPAVQAARAGKHVVVEKPLEITLPRCDAIIAACDAAGVRLCTIFPSRFTPANLRLKEAIDLGRFGRLTLGDTHVKWWRTQQYYDSGGWRGTWQLDGGGALMNQAIHNVDLLYWLMGDVASITALTATLAHERIEVEDTAVAALRFKNGALGVIEAATSAYPGLLEADRDPRRPRLGAGRARRPHALGLPGEGAQRQRGLRRHGRSNRLQGRRQRPARHHPHRPPRPARRLPRRRSTPDAIPRSTAARDASRSRSSGRSTARRRTGKLVELPLDDRTENMVSTTT